jgi:archaemetzincin
MERLPVLKGRKQVDADALLQALEQRAAPDGRVLMGITGLDMGTRIFQYVFGRARKAGRAALVSVARLDPGFYGLPPDPDLTRRRLVLEILHELGHVCGIDHCEDFSCRMHFVANVESLDLRGNGLCPLCKTLELPGRKLAV